LEELAKASSIGFFFAGKQLGEKRAQLGRACDLLVLHGPRDEIFAKLAGAGTLEHVMRQRLLDQEADVERQRRDARRPIGAVLEHLADLVDRQLLVEAI